MLSLHSSGVGNLVLIAIVAALIWSGMLFERLRHRSHRGTR